MMASFLPDWVVGGPLADAGTLEWAAPGWLVGLAAALAAVAWALGVWTGTRATAGRRALELGLWALALAVLVVGISRPEWIEASGRAEPARLVVLVDGSASMDVLEGGAPRSQGVGAILDIVQDAAGGGLVDQYTFDEDLRPGLPTAYTGRGTDLGAALAGVSDRYLGQDLRGVVVITDGIDRGALRPAIAAGREGGGIDPSVLPALPGPLTIYQVGMPSELEDVAIEDVVSGGFAFLRTPFKLDVRLRGRPGSDLPVTLAREGSRVDAKVVTLDDEGRGSVLFSVTPTSVGRFAWEVSVPTEANDAVPGNNSFPVVIRVVRDRTRVLQVCGSPSYDQKFLRLFLKEDPSVDLVSFFILRTQSDFAASWRADELSLISFPYTRLFTDDLDTFDMVVLQNFNYADYFSWNGEELLDNLARYVVEGGALVMVGGDRSFDLAGYGGTPLARVLPVRMGGTGAQVDEAPFRPALTPAGALHPITRLAGTPGESQAIWERLPAMDGQNLVRGLASDSAALLEHPELRTEEGLPMPVVAVREVGRGRTMAMMVDASWRWSFSEAAVGRGNQAYLRFWKNTLRWLVADPEDQRVVVTPARENVLLGDAVRLVMRVRDSGYGPVAGREVEGEVTAPSGKKTNFTLVTDVTGEASTEYQPTERGAHRVHVRAGTGPMDEGETVIAASARDPELVEIAPDHRSMRDLAAVLGERGAWVAPGASDPPLLDESAARLVADRRVVPLGTVPLVAVLFAILSSGAWWVRRRSGGR